MGATEKLPSSSIVVGAILPLRMLHLRGGAERTKMTVGACLVASTPTTLVTLDTHRITKTRYTAGGSWLRSTTSATIIEAHMPTTTPRRLTASTTSTSATTTTTTRLIVMGRSHRRPLLEPCNPQKGIISSSPHQGIRIGVHREKHPRAVEFGRIRHGQRILKPINKIASVSNKIRSESCPRIVLHQPDKVIEAVEELGHQPLLQRIGIQRGPCDHRANTLLRKRAWPQKPPNLELVQSCFMKLG